MVHFWKKKFNTKNMNNVNRKIKENLQSRLRPKKKERTNWVLLHLRIHRKNLFRSRTSTAHIAYRKGAFLAAIHIWHHRLSSCSLLVFSNLNSIKSSFDRAVQEARRCAPARRPIHFYTYNINSMPGALKSQFKLLVL